ncbi:DNA-binding transcriptional MerR regulator [Azospirillum rugosum]|uniref:DNA-binding transcriptional MerR regulator n=2 Tax=Azospirillaceae TaxID=2829815 RepID=A0ABS4SEX8_9PROT|nr:DNA-binding transcriptional MerR regulator [Azospirillum rugosum]MDQ0524976.1 DNA-binding transcriptional MerR regulator [Azospirillum rugosum]
MRRDVTEGVPPTMEQLYTVNQLAEELGITPRALRFYEVKGLLSPNRVGNNRVYTKRDRARLKLILRGKRLGFSLAEIREYLDLYNVDGGVEQLKVLLKRIDARLRDLAQQREDLEATVEELKDIESQVVAALDDRGVKAKSA